MCRALNEQVPQRFFKILQSCGAFEILLPDIHLNDADYQALNYVVLHTDRNVACWAVFFCRQQEIYLIGLLQRYRVPKVFYDCALMTCRWYTFFYQIKKQSSDAILNFIRSNEIIRRPERFSYFHQPCQAYYQNVLLDQNDFIQHIVCSN
jgi:hypothetical protein